MSEPPEDVNLVAMIDAALDGALDDGQCTELMDRLRVDAGARSLYRARAQLHAMLHWVGRPMVATEDESIEAREVSFATEVDRRRRMIVPVAAGLAASVLILVTLGFLLWPETPTEPTRARGPVVGVLTAADSVLWGSEPIDTGDNVHGTPFTILGGTLDMQLNSGVELEVRGATTAVVDDPMNVHLHSGTLFARAPEGVSGFTVHAPGGLRVTDLGTAFEVRADASGTTFIRVTEGSVRAEKSTGESIVVGAGYAVEHTASGLTFQPAAGESALIHRWTFNDGGGRDDVGGVSGELSNGASVEAGRLVLDGNDDYLRSDYNIGPLTAKTLVAWVDSANLDQQGGSVLTVEQGVAEDEFDAIVFGELTPRVWMAGSNSYTRSRRAPQAGEPEEASPGETINVALVYDADGTIRVYRNGQPYSTHRADGPVTFDKARVLIGKRHSRATPVGAYFAGAIDEARVYNRALSADEIEMIHAQGPVPAAPDELDGDSRTSHQSQGDKR